MTNLELFKDTYDDAEVRCHVCHNEVWDNGRQENFYCENCQDDYAEGYLTEDDECHWVSTLFEKMLLGWREPRI